MELDELFTGKKSESRRSKGAAVASEKKTENKSAYVGEGSDVRVKPISGDPKIPEAVCGGVLETVEKACGGNRYLEAMILGEILNGRPRRGRL